MKKVKFYAFLLICLFAITASLSCSGGGGGGGVSSTAPAASPVSEAGPAPAPAPAPVYAPIQYADTTNKGIIITIATPGNTAIAVLVGPREYPAGYSLNYTVNDADVVRLSLVGSAFWAGSTVTFTQSNVRVTKAMIVDAINNAKANLANNGLFVFFFSGHGTNSSGLGYIIPYDGISGLGAFVAANAISENDLRAILDEFTADVPGSIKYVLIDSCNSGLFIDKSMLPPELPGYIRMTPKFIEVKGSDPNYDGEQFAKSVVGSADTYMMTASKGSEVSWESSGLQNGVFAYFLCKGLGQGATIGPASSDGGNTITAEDLTVYAPDLVNNYITTNKPGYTQQPQSYDNVAGTLRVK